MHLIILTGPYSNDEIEAAVGPFDDRESAEAELRRLLDEGMNEDGLGQTMDYKHGYMTCNGIIEVISPAQFRHAFGVQFGMRDEEESA